MSEAIKEQLLNNTSSNAPSVSDGDDMATIRSKFKQLRRENIQLKNLLRQNEVIV